mmetsp:Transcript_30880/g.90253  ORF Transcript_30880/g.90253 Transcript_30880/m.90253 type:complete len:261 (-) Transcript_30880:454-1236(-)
MVRLAVPPRRRVLSASPICTRPRPPSRMSCSTSAGSGPGWSCTSRRSSSTSSPRRPRFAAASARTRSPPRPKTNSRRACRRPSTRLRWPAASSRISSSRRDSSKRRAVTFGRRTRTLPSRSRPSFVARLAPLVAAPAMVAVPMMISSNSSPSMISRCATSACFVSTAVSATRSPNWRRSSRLMKRRPSLPIVRPSWLRFARSAKSRPLLSPVSSSSEIFTALSLPSTTATFSPLPRDRAVAAQLWLLPTALRLCRRTTRN